MDLSKLHQSPAVTAARMALAPSAAPIAPILPFRRAGSPASGPMGPMNPAAPSVRQAIFFNSEQELGASVAPATGSVNPFVGAPGSANNAGNINGAAGNLSYGPGGMPAVGMVGKFQLENPGVDLALRIGLPVIGIIMLSKESVAGLGVAALAVGAVLWANRLTSVNL